MRLRPPAPVLISVLAGLCFCGSLSPAAAAVGWGADAQTLNAAAVTAMDSGRWEEALELLTACVQRYDAGALKRFGPSFGVSWYRKGICEMRLQQWGEAARSFQKCYQDYPDDGLGANPYNRRALLRGAEAAQAGGNPQEAIRLYRKFLAERNREEDSFQPASLYLSLALCEFATENIEDGVIDFETALQNRSAFGAPDQGIAAVFQAMLKCAAQLKEEKLLTGFIARNRGDLLVDPAEMACGGSDLFLMLGNESGASSLPAAALAFYSLVPDADLMVEDLEDRLAHPGGLDEARLEKYRTALARQRAGVSDVRRLEGCVAAFGMLGDAAGAVACGEVLEQRYGGSPRRQDHLLTLVRTCAGAGAAEKAARYGELFLKDFPEAGEVLEVRRRLMAAQFAMGRRLECAATAEKLLAQVEQGSPEDDAASYYLAAANYDLGRSREAMAVIDRQTGQFPHSEYRARALWLQAMIRVRLGLKEEAATLLDGLTGEGSSLSGATDRPLLGSALLELAALAAEREDWEAVVAAGDRLRALGPVAGADQRRLALLEGEALAGLKKNDEALERLGPVITDAECAEDERVHAVRVYAEVFLRAREAGDLAALAREFPGVAATDERGRRILAQICCGLLSVLDDPARSADGGWKSASEPLLADLMEEAKERFAPAEMSGGLLIRMGDFLRTRDQRPREALKYYEEVLKHPESALRGRAVLGKAAVLADGDEDDRKQAAEALESNHGLRDGLDAVSRGAWQELETGLAQQGGGSRREGGEDDHSADR